MFSVRIRNHLFRSDCDNVQHTDVTSKLGENITLERGFHALVKSYSLRSPWNSATTNSFTFEDNHCVVNKYCGCFTVNLFSLIFFFPLKRHIRFCSLLKSYFDPILFAFMRFFVITWQSLWLNNKKCLRVFRVCFAACSLCCIVCVQLYAGWLWLNWNVLRSKLRIAHKNVRNRIDSSRAKDGKFEGKIDRVQIKKKSFRLSG